MLSSVSRRYVAAVDELAPLADPVVPVEELAPVPEVKCVRRNLVLMSPVVPEVPVVPVADWSALWTHPVTVILSVELCVLDELDVWAARLAVAARTSAKQVPLHRLACMVVSSSSIGSWRSSRSANEAPGQVRNGRPRHP